MASDNCKEFYNKHAEGFASKIATKTLYNTSYSHLLSIARLQNSILDLACGPANVTEFIVSKNTNIEVTCVDFAPNMIEIARSKFPNADFYISDITNLEIPQKQYDIIVCAFGLPYVQKNKISLFTNSILPYTHNASTIYISCMQGTDESRLDSMSFANNAEILVHFHSKETIEKALMNIGFSLVSYSEQDYIEPDNSITIDMIFMFQKQ